MYEITELVNSNERKNNQTKPNNERPSSSLWVSLLSQANFQPGLKLKIFGPPPKLVFAGGIFGTKFRIRLLWQSDGLIPHIRPNRSCQAKPCERKYTDVVLVVYTKLWISSQRQLAQFYRVWVKMLAWILAGSCSFAGKFSPLAVSPGYSANVRRINKYRILANWAFRHSRGGWLTPPLSQTHHQAWVMHCIRLEIVERVKLGLQNSVLHFCTRRVKNRGAINITLTMKKFVPLIAFVLKLILGIKRRCLC